MRAKIKNVDCAQQSEAVAWALGSFSDRDDSSFEQHLERCPACRLEVAKTKGTLATIREFSRLEPSEKLAPKIMAAIKHTNRAPYYWRWGAAAAAAVIFAFWIATTESPIATGLFG